MERKATSGIMLTLLLISMLTLAFNIQTVKAEPRTWIVDDDKPADFRTIQEAINAAGEGDKIFVKNGVYYENPVVNKAVLMVGENRENTVVDGKQVGDVFLVTSSNVRISNFKIMNSSIGYNGICLSRVQKCVISNCSITQNHIGIFLYYSSNNTVSSNNVTNSWDGIILENSTNNLLCENRLTNNMDCGICIGSSSNNTLRSNKLANNLGSGILILSSPNNTLRNNSVSGSFANFGVWDSNELLPNFIQDIDTSNTVNGKPIYYWINKKDQKVPSDAGCVSAINSSNIIVDNVNLSNNYHGVLFFYTTNSSLINSNITANSYGIKLCYSSYNEIFGNRVAGNAYGIRLDSSSNNNTLCRNTIVDNPKLYGILIDSSVNNTLCENIITDDQCGILIGYYSRHNFVHRNNITNNANHGIWIDDYSNSNIVTENNVINNWCGIRVDHSSSDNIFYHNNFIDNTNAFDVAMSCINVWDDGYPPGGNYWSDYTDVDLYCGSNQNIRCSDGIWDHEYVINPSNRDNYPLVKPYVSGNLSVSIYTDRYTYHRGGTMHLGLNVTSPDSVKYLCFAIWVELPDASIYLYRHEHSVVLPIGLNYANPAFKSITIPSLPSGIYTWHAAFFERSTHTIIAEDTSEWEFV